MTNKDESNPYIDYLNQVLMTIEDTLSVYQTREDKSTGEIIKECTLMSNWKLVNFIIQDFEMMKNE